MPRYILKHPAAQSAIAVQMENTIEQEMKAAAENGTGMIPVQKDQNGLVAIGVEYIRHALIFDVTEESRGFGTIGFR